MRAHTVTGDIAMKGLPDIYTTQIAFTNGAVRTSGKEVFRFAPMLRGMPGFDIAQLHSIQYNGSFTGYIDNFAAGWHLAHQSRHG